MREMFTCRRRTSPAASSHRERLTVCLNVALSRGGWAVIASDHRHSTYLPNGGIERHDLGGKLCRIGSGWVTASGSATYAALAIEALIREGVNAAAPDAVAECIARSAAVAPAIIAERWPHTDPTLNESGSYLVAAGSLVASIDPKGKIKRPAQEELVLVAFPAGFPESDMARHADALTNAIARARSLGAIVRIVAAEFAQMAERYAGVSPTFSLAWDDCYLTGNAFTLAFASDLEIRAARQDPPAVSPETLSAILTRNAA